MFAVNILCHLWDLVNEGVDAALDVVQGRIGAGGVCVPLTAGVTRHLRFATDVPPRWFISRGGVFFQPDRGRYANTRCAPILSDWLKGRDPFARVVEGCRKRGLALRARVECTNLGRIAERYPFAARKNVFGDPSPSQICLVNPDVAEVIRALAGDICANHGIEVIELTGLDAMWPPAPDVDLDIGLGARQLMALCFCESCRQSAGAAGVDVPAAARSTTARLERLFRTGRPITEPLSTLAADDAALLPFIRWYRAGVGELFLSLKRAYGCRIASHSRALRAGESLGPDGVYAAGADIVVCDYADRETEPMVELAAQIRPMLFAEQALEMQLPVQFSFAADPQSLVRNLTRAAEMGVSSVTVDCHGHIPAEGIEVVKQGVRFARRTTIEGGGH